MLFFYAAWKKSRQRLSASVRGTPLRLEELETRLVPYAVSGNAWPNPQLITISFEPDGTVLGTNSSGGAITSNLISTLNTKLGGPQPGQQFAPWQVQILKAAQSWAQQTNINLEVVSDDGAPSGSGNYEQGDPNYGDIRIGGYAMGTTGPLAMAYQPPPVNNYSIAGDIVFNTSESFHIGSTYDLFTVAAHEMGHALGMDHSAKSAAVMYATYTATKPTLNADDIAGIQSIYGVGRSPDVYNLGGGFDGTIATASNLTSLVLNPLTLVGQVTDLDITTTSDIEFFKFIAPVGTASTATVTVQSSGLSLLSPKVTVYAADQATVLGSANGAGQYGTTLNVTLSSVTAGELLYVKVQGADSTPFSTGDYGLTLNFGTGPSPTIASPVIQSPNGYPLQSGGGEAEGAANGNPEGPGSDAFSGNSDPSSPSLNTPQPGAVHLLGVTFVGAAGILPVSASNLVPFGWGPEGPNSASGHDYDTAFLALPISPRTQTSSGANDYFWLMHNQESHLFPGDTVGDSADGNGSPLEDLAPL
jgi:Matrixin